MKILYRTAAVAALAANVALHAWRYLSELYNYTSTVGFSSDDAWIHMTFARNIARHLEFAYTPGVPSTGSTAPLWTAILGAFHFVSTDTNFVYWTATAFNCLLLVASAVVLFSLVRKLFSNTFAAAAAALLLVNEWHMIWAALSGMEIILFVFLELVVLRVAVADRPRPLALGALGGLIFLTRPEGVLLFAIAAGYAFYKYYRSRTIEPIPWKRIALMFLLALVVVSPALGFYLYVDGSLVPNTFHAKGRFYCVDERRWEYIPNFMGDIYNFFALDHMLVLAPWAVVAFLYVIVKLVGRLKAETWMLIMLWALVFLAAYSWKLPKGFQRGRYIMPVAPLFIGVVSGMLFTFLERLRHEENLTLIQTFVFSATLVFAWPVLKPLEEGVAWPGYPARFEEIYVSSFPAVLLAVLPVLALVALYCVRWLRPAWTEWKIPLLSDPETEKSEHEENRDSELTERRSLYIPDTFYGIARYVALFLVVLFTLEAYWDANYPSAAYPHGDYIKEYQKTHGGARPPDMNFHLGRNAFIWDVLNINDQHVVIGKYVNEHTPPGSVIATHDIGALAYFGDRPVVDMIGLVTPELSPFCHNHGKLKRILAGRDKLSEKIIGPYTRDKSDHVDYFALFSNPGAGFYEGFARHSDLKRLKDAKFSMSPEAISVYSLFKFAPDGKED